MKKNEKAHIITLIKEAFSRKVSVFKMVLRLYNTALDITYCLPKVVLWQRRLYTNGLFRYWVYELNAVT